MATSAHKVVKGDTLWAIADKYKGENGYTNISLYLEYLVKLNHLSNPDYIVVGQIIKLNGTVTADSKHIASRVSIKVLGIQSNTDRTAFVSWKWNRTNTKEYKVRWWYDSGDGIWFGPSESTTVYKHSTYTAPENATRVKVEIFPVSQERTVNGKKTTYWTAYWSTEKNAVLSMSETAPAAPKNAPSVEYNKNTHVLTATISGLPEKSSDGASTEGIPTAVDFLVYQDDQRTYMAKYNVPVDLGAATYALTVASGHTYKVRCRAKNSIGASDWTSYSSVVKTVPAVPKEITVCKATSKTSIYLEWTEVSGAETYTIQYTTKLEYFDITNNVQSQSGIAQNKYELTGLESGHEYFFRVCAVNGVGESNWSKKNSTVIGTTPMAPTTWSSTSTAIVGEQVKLYWVHNSEDGSDEKYAQIFIVQDGNKIWPVFTVEKSTDEDEKDKTSFYEIDTSSYPEGTTFIWQVRTAGATNEVGEYSVARTVEVYARPTLSIDITDKDSNSLETITQFPFYISALAGPNTQTPIGYHVSISADDSYETINDLGNTQYISAGSDIYSKYFDVSEDLLVEFKPNNINLDNNVRYTLKAVVSMNSGLTAEATRQFDVAWDDVLYEPTAEIGIDKETYSASIRPYCEDENEQEVTDILLSVYRREFDGSFTEIITGIPGGSNTFVTDPHPSLDYARYRIVAITPTTGAVSYCDLPGYPTGANCVIIQWDEVWSNFDSTSEDALEEPTWAGSILKLPYNIDVSDSNKTDVSLVEYIGRKHPVSYYGTQLGSSATWNMAIPKNDKETLYALRRLAVWTGNVYVREPSGSGYWASVAVSFNQKHKSVTIPVTLQITRVEGGV